MWRQGACRLDNEQEQRAVTTSGSDRDTGSGARTVAGAGKHQAIVLADGGRVKGKAIAVAVA